MSDEPRTGDELYADADRVERYLRHRHDEARSPNLSMEEPALLAAVGDCGGLDIVELGCGDGSFASVAVAMGCRSYFGVDVSAPMVERAQVRLAATHGVVEQIAVEDVELPAASADLVVSRMVLHYIAGIDGALRKIRRCLRPGGRAVVTVVHPVITSHDNVGEAGLRESWVVDRYFESGPRTHTWFGEPVLWHHRTIEEYLTSVRSAGLELTSFSECPPATRLFAGDHDELARRRRVPLFLLLVGAAPRRTQPSADD